MKTEKKELAARDNLKIKLGFNLNMEDGPCALCGASCKPDGLDFYIEGTKAFACAGCAREKAPELVEIHNDAHRWREATDTAAEDYDHGRKIGIEEGRAEAGRLIFEAINEPIEKRLLRLLEKELSVKQNTGPFSEDEITF